MSRVAHFGLFEADIEEGNLRKQGRVIKLQRQPFEMLRILIERPNQMVTREELRAQLWPSGIVVDFDQSLNKYVTKLRDALGDSASNPRFIETVPKRGYRFIAPVSTCASQRPAAPAPPEPVTTPVIEAPAQAPPAPPSFSVSALIPAGIMAALVVALLSVTANSRRPDRAANVAQPIADVPGTAKDLYARGRITLLRGSEEGLRNGVDLFNRAIAIAPAYDAAYVGAADAWSLLASYGMDEPRAAVARARQYAGRALAINPASAEAHASLGRTSMLGDWDWELSESHFTKAIALNPSYATAHQWYAYLLSATGRHADAEREAMRAADLEPLSLNAATAVGYVQFAARRFDQAAATLRRILEIDPDFAQARRNLGLVLAMQGRTGEAVAECERVARLTGDSNVSLADLAWVKGQAGDRAGARRILAQLEARRATKYVPADLLARALVGAGDSNRAVDALSAAFDSRVATLVTLAVDPAWDELREAPKLKALVQAFK